MECLRERIDFGLSTNPTRAKKLIVKLTTQHCAIITNMVVAIKKQSLKLLSIGQSISPCASWIYRKL